MRESKAMVKFVAGFTYTCEGFRFQIAKWTTKCCHPLSIIEDEELIEAFWRLHALVTVPSQFSVGQDVFNDDVMSHNIQITIKNHY